MFCFMPYETIYFLTFSQVFECRLQYLRIFTIILAGAGDKKAIEDKADKVRSIHLVSMRQFERYVICSLL